MTKDYICDCCGKKVKSEYDINGLVKDLRGKNIKDMCDICFKPLEKFSYDLRMKLSTEMNKKIREQQRMFIRELAIKNGVYL